MLLLFCKFFIMKIKINIKVIWVGSVVTMFIVAADGVACLVFQNPIGWYVPVQWGETAVGAVYLGGGGVRRTEAVVVAVSVPPLTTGVSQGLATTQRALIIGTDSRHL